MAMVMLLTFVLQIHRTATYAGRYYALIESRELLLPMTLCIASDITQDLPRLLPPLTELGLTQLS